MQIRNYKKSDEKAVFGLWNSNLKDKWPIDRVIFFSIINSSKKVKNVVLEDGKKILGFISLDTAKKDKGSIKLILIDKKYQRKGLGKLLMDFGLAYLKNAGVKTVFLGSGGSSYFWPGIPENLPNAILFFKSFKFNYHGKDVDLVGELKKFSLPKKISNFEIDLLKKEDIEQLLKFEKKNFPYWLEHFEFEIKRGDLKNILIAKSASNKIIGSILLFGPYIGKPRTDFKWRKIFSNKMGGTGALGVDRKMRGRGVGKAIVIKAIEILEKRGVKKIYGGWVDLDFLIRWYLKIGYKNWMSYQMAKKKI
ncbi:MAG: GNAT family N-acetyltransferase [Patescibacteria group bacterium]|nr:GNAT family N-acetyltransferase [Patescibacteria group bacterium]